MIFAEVALSASYCNTCYYLPLMYTLDCLFHHTCPSQGVKKGPLILLTHFCTLILLVCIHIIIAVNSVVLFFQHLGHLKSRRSRPHKENLWQKFHTHKPYENMNDAFWSLVFYGIIFHLFNEISIQIKDCPQRMQ